MGELRRRGAGSPEYQDVLVGIREMVLAADDVADAQIDVVGAGCQMIGGHAVGAEQGEILDIVSKFDLFAVDRVVETDLLVRAAGNTEAKGKGFSRGGPAFALFAGKFAHAGVVKPGLTGTRFFTFAGVGWRKVAIRQALLENSLSDLAMERETLRLFVFLVPAQIEPAQTFENRIDGSVGIALDVGIVESQDHGSAIPTGIKPVEDEGAGAANVQKTCGRWRKSNARHNF